MNRQTLVLIGLFIIVGASVIVYLRTDIELAPETEVTYANPAIAIGEEAPDLELKDLGGKIHYLKNFRGKVVLVNFWATWCPPCISEMPSLVSVYNQFKDRGFEVLAISLDEKKASVNELVKKLNIPFPVFFDPEGATAHRYLVYGLPYTVLIDRQGRLRHKIFGGHDWTKGKPFEKITELM